MTHDTDALVNDLRSLYDKLTDVELAIDEQTYDECRKADFDLPDDYEFSLNLPAKHKRAITKAVNGLNRAADAIGRLTRKLGKASKKLEATELAHSLEVRRGDAWKARAETAEAIAALQPSSAEREELAKWCEGMAGRNPFLDDAYIRIAALLRTPVAVDDAMVERAARATCKVYCCSVQCADDEHKTCGLWQSHAPGCEDALQAALGAQAGGE